MLCFKSSCLGAPVNITCARIKRGVQVCECAKKGGVSNGGSEPAPHNLRGGVHSLSLITTGGAQPLRALSIIRGPLASIAAGRRQGCQSARVYEQVHADAREARASLSWAWRGGAPDCWRGRARGRRRRSRSRPRRCGAACNRNCDELPLAAVAAHAAGKVKRADRVKSHREGARRRRWGQRLEARAAAGTCAHGG